MQNDSASGMILMPNNSQKDKDCFSLLPEKEEFITKNPNTWPPNPQKKDMKNILEKIVKETMINELENVIGDIKKSNGTLQVRGHVIALALLCAVDTISSYAYFKCFKCKREHTVSFRYKEFINNFFPQEYKKYSKKIYSLYRCASVHNWHFFEVQICPGNEPIEKDNNVLKIGLLKFFNDFKLAVDKFLEELGNNEKMQESALCRYMKLKKCNK